jgi:HlyD family secretion protein
MTRKSRFAVLRAITGMFVIFAIALSRLKPLPPSVSCEGSVWTEAVTKGPMPWDVRGTGSLVRAQNPARLIARVTVLDAMAGELRLKQKADLDMRNIKLKGSVIYINPSPSNGERSIDIVAKSGLSEGVGVGQEVDATIHLGTIENILYVGRPVHAYQYSTIHVFKVVDDGQRAVRVVVKFGRASVNAIEVLDGLKQGDKIIPSDMSAWDNFDQIKLK